MSSLKVLLRWKRTWGLYLGQNSHASYMHSISETSEISETSLCWVIMILFYT